MKKILALLLSLLMLLSLPVLAEQAAPAGEEAPALQKDLMILFTSDVHCGIDQGFGYVGLAAIRDYYAKDNYVLLVDNGDAIQGEPVGTMTRGSAIIDLMNALKYDVATIGNHEFDYGMDTFMELSKKASFPYISANFTHNDELVFAPYQIFDLDGVKVAFVGVTTPTTFTSSTPTYFQDENGNYVYGFMEDESGAKLYEAVQKAVDDARDEGARYVICLSHLGIEASASPWMSSELLANTTGIDALLDGHSHSILESEMVRNKEGHEVPEAACGTKLQAVGYCKISAEDGSVKTGLLQWKAEVSAPELLGLSNEMSAPLEAATAALNESLAKVVARTQVDLIITDPATDVRVIRNLETNLGDLCADAYRAMSGADIALVNGGGIRQDIPAGDITMEQIYKVHPFGNKLCVAEATGQEILDALEWTSRNTPDENGGFLQVSGLSYEIHTDIPSTATSDDKGNFTGVTGKYRVQNVMVGDAPLDLEKTYTVASHNYMLKDGGDGTNMFMDNKIVLDEIMIDNQVLINYITENLGGVVGEQYGDIWGEGRIKVLPEA